MGKIDRSSLAILIGGFAGALLLAALVFVRIFVVGYYVIPQNGMYPGMPAGSRLITLQHPYAAPAEVKRGDIVVFTHEIDAERFTFIWRVVGLPGDTVEVSGASLAINGRPVVQEKVREQNGTTIFREHAGEAVYEIAVIQSQGQEGDQDKALPGGAVTVSPDHFFVLGDNRLDARDSRYLGLVPFAAIIGRKW